MVWYELQIFCKSFINLIKLDSTRTCSSARVRFADDLTLICNSAVGMSRLVQLVADFCNWSRMGIKIAKLVITAYDYSTQCDLPTEDIWYQGQALTRLPADESYPYLGIRASLVPTGRRRGPGSSQGLTAKKEHVMSAAKELGKTTRVPARTNGAGDADGACQPVSILCTAGAVDGRGNGGPA